MPVTKKYLNSSLQAKIHSAFNNQIFSKSYFGQLKLKNYVDTRQKNNAR